MLSPEDHHLKKFSLPALATVFLLSTTTASFAATVAEQCSASKGLLAGKLSLCLIQAKALLQKKGDVELYKLNVARCNASQDIAWAALDRKISKGGSNCPSVSTAREFANYVTGCVEGLDLGLAGRPLPPNCVPCKSQLGTCSADLQSCNETAATCDAARTDCVNSLGQLNTEIAQCKADLATCLGPRKKRLMKSSWLATEPPILFPDSSYTGPPSPEQSPLHGAGSAQKFNCQAAKISAAGRYALCLAKARLQLAAQGQASYAVAIAKCEAKQRLVWAKLEKKAFVAHTSCPSTGDAQQVEQYVRTCSGDITTALSGQPLPTGCGSCPDDLTTCEDALTACATAVTGCNSSLNDCRASQDNANNELATCRADLEQCEGVSTTTSMSSTTSTTGVPPLACTIVFDLKNAVTLGSFSFDIDYSAVPGHMIGSGGTTQCTTLAGGTTIRVNDVDATKKATAGGFAIAGVTGPVNLVSCDFLANTTPVKADFTLTGTEATDVNGDPTAIPAYGVASINCTGPTTTTTLAPTTTTTIPDATTTTTLSGPVQYKIRFKLNSACGKSVGSLGLDIHYAGTGGQFDGTGASVSCTNLVAGGPTFVPNDDDAGQVLSLGYISLTGFTAPTDLAECLLTGPKKPSASDFVVTFTDISDPDGNSLQDPAICGGGTPPGISVSITP